ncbi:MAG: hypothetical protein DRJ59_03060 [Thermoprotei archaeon]|nr:MAG: hypothetical protein DRJ59_03060 [Thermoprotei archaeon]
MKVEKRLVEEWLPLYELKNDSEAEQSFGKMSVKRYKDACLRLGMRRKKWVFFDPKIRSLHLWLARRPCGLSRALTLACFLAPEDREVFNEVIGLTKLSQLDHYPPLILYTNPNRTLLASRLNRDLKDIVVVDPMAGGGAIPLESLRLGLRTIAIEYNPVAYIILKATLEYPAKYGEKLYEDVREEAKALIEYAKNELSKYYAEDAYNYIIARGVKCPNPDCNGLVPIIHGTRLRRNGPYINFQFNKKEKKFKVSVADEETEFEKLRCPYCGRPFTRDEVFSQWIPKHKEILRIALEGDVEKAKDYVDVLIRTHIPLLKQIRRGFAPCEDEDVDRLVNAYLDLARQAKKLKQYLPNSPIPKENDVFKPIKSLGIDYWYELFNPRQLLVFLKLVKYVSERTKELTRDKGEYGAAIATYLALGLDKLFNYNNITTMWHTTHGVMKSLDAHYSAKRSVSLGLEYCEAKRIDLALDWAFEPDAAKPTATRGGLCPVLKQLCKWLHGLGDRVEVYMGDARELSKIIGERSVDLVNVDPPYFNQHFYSDLSEFFWQFLMLMLKPAIDAGFLFNRDESRGRVECLVSGWSPSLPIVPRAGEIIVRRGRGKPDVAEVSFTKEWWREQMWRFFTECYNTLKDDGILIVWYTHTDPQAWAAVLSGLYASRFVLSKIWNVRTEMQTRQVALTGSAFFTSLILVARKTGESVIVGERTLKELLFNERVKEVITESVADALQSARVSGASDKEAYVMALAGAIAGATRIRNPAVETAEFVASETLNKYMGEAREREIARRMFKRTSEFFRGKLYPVALYLGASRVLEEKLKRAGLSEEQRRLIVGADDITKAYLIFWLSTRYVEEGARAFVDYDFAEKICKILDIRISTMETYGLVKKLQKTAYTVLFGRGMFEAVRNRLELLERTVAGQAIYLLKLIVDSPIRDDEERCARDVLSKKPVSKQVVATAIFLLRTALKDELESASISEFRKPFIEGVLKTLYAR